MPFLIIFVVVPLLELMVFAHVSKFIGLFTALILAFLTAIIGGAIVRHQGLQTISSMQKAARAGQIPLNELFDGFCLIAAGATLITPGFITDAIGFLLLMPAVRGALRGYIKNHTNWAASMHTSQHTPDPTIIEGEYEDLGEDRTNLK